MRQVAFHFVYPVERPPIKSVKRFSSATFDCKQVPKDFLQSLLQILVRQASGANLAKYS